MSHTRSASPSADVARDAPATAWRLAPSAAAAPLDTLLPLEAELAYGNFTPLATRPGAVIGLHRRRWTEEMPGAMVIGAHDPAGNVLAAVRVEHRDFESSHFGIPMARIDRPAAVSDLDRRALGLRCVYQEAFRTLREAGYGHVAVRASTRDRTAAWVLQECGAFHVDTQVSWICPLTGVTHDDALPPNLTTEVYERGATWRVDPPAWRRLIEWSSRAFDRGPFVFDHTLPYDRALALYAAWTERASSGEWADTLVLVRDGPDVVAFIALQLLEDLSEAAGIVVLGRGLGATLPQYHGLFTAIQREYIARRPLNASFLENETQVSTIGSINVYARLGNRYMRSTSTFHLRLDGHWPR